MAATENSANTLKINIVADANPAKQALADVGKAAIETKEKIEGLGKAFSDSTKRITDLTHDVNTLRTAIGQKSFGLTGMEDSARRIEVHLTNAISLANRLAKTSFANNGFTAAEKSLDRIIAKMREPIDAFRVKEDSMAKAEAWLADMRKKFSRPISVFEVTRANTKKLENLLNLLNADREKRGAYIKSEIELLREQRLNYRAAQEAADAAGKAQVGMARTYKNVLKAQESLIGARDLKAIATLNATQGVGGNKTVIVDKSKHVNNQRGVHALPANGGFMPIPGGFGTFVGAMGARDFWNNVVELQQRKARVSAWNLTPAQKVQWETQRQWLMRDNKLISNAESESMMMAAASSLGHYDPKTVGGTVGAATKYAQMERVMGYNKSEADDIVKNYYGVAEARQVTNDVQKVLDTFKTVFNITTTTAGKISVADIETIMRNMGPGAATISDEGLLRLLAYAEQIKVAGKGSSGSTGAGISTVGTNVKMLQLMAMGKPSAINAKKSLAQLGLLDDGVYSTYANKDTTVYDQNGNKYYNGAAYDRNGKLILKGDGSAGSKEAQEIARLIFERGDWGQVLGKVFVKGSKELAQAGAYKKELAQQDPVKWVEEITNLIDLYVSKRENRAIYFGKAGQESAKNGESDEDFRKNLTDAQKTSAQTTFWAKTGLSQRVLTALSTFSNTNFQIRSAEMMETAKKQKSVDELMREQIEMGNLTLASESLKKAIVRLTEAFEPMTSWIGKAMLAVSDLVDKLTAWVSDYQALAGITAGWLVMKSLISSLKMLGVVFDEVAMKELKAANAAREMQRAQTTAALTAGAAGAKASEQMGVKQSMVANIPLLGGFSRALNSSYNMVTSWADKVKVVIGTLGIALSKCVTVFGAAWLAIDVASIFAGWLVEFTQFGKDCKAIWDKLIDSINNSKIVLNYKYDDDKYRTSEQNERAAELKKRMDEIDTELKGSMGNSFWFGSGQEAQGVADKVGALKAERASLQKEYDAMTKGIADIRKKAHTAIVGMIEGLDKKGTFEKSKAYLNATDKFKEFTDLLASKEGEIKQAPDAVRAKHRENFNKYDQAELETMKKFFDLFGSDEVVSAYSELEKFLKGVESAELRADIINEFYNLLEQKFVKGLGEQSAQFVKDMFGILRKTSKARADSKTDMLGFDTLVNGLRKKATGLLSIIPGLEKLLAPSKQEKEAQKGKPGAEKKKDEPQLNRQSGTQITDEETVSFVDRLFANQKRNQNRYKSALQDSGNYETWEETRARMRQQFVDDWVGGKYTKHGKTAFLTYDPLRNGTDGLTEKDIDFDGTHGGMVGGKTANMKIDLDTYTERLNMFKKDFGDLFRNSTKNVEAARRATEEARISMDETAGFMYDSKSIRDFDAETKLQLENMRKNGTGDPEKIKKYENDRAKIRAYMAEQELAQNVHSDNEYVRNYNLSKMTEKEQTVENYGRNKEIAISQYVQKIRQIQESAAIGEDEKNKQIEEAQAAHVKKMLAMEDEFQRKMQGYDDTYLKQKIENWRDSGSYMKEMQDTIMDGFVTANEKWLDGDKNSWRDYLNDILKMWRRMVLQMGYSKLLGGITDWATKGIKSFVDGAFGLADGASTQSVDKKKTEESKPVTFSSPLSSDAADNDYDLGAVWTAKRQQNMLQPVQSVGGFGTPSSSLTNPTGTVQWSGGFGGGASTQGSSGWGLKSSGISGSVLMGDTQSSGYGLSYGSGMDSGGSDSGADMSGFNSQLGETTSTLAGMTSTVGQFGQALGMSQETTQQLNVTMATFNMLTMLSNVWQKLKNAFSSTETTQQAEGVVQEGLFNGGLQLGTTALAQFTAAVESSAVASTFSANGNIMTDHGPLPLKKYANGGIAKKAQVSIFGEGRTPEAYVPLPDGRSIPVSMNVDGLGGESDSVGGNQVVINISVNNNGGSTTETESTDGSSQNADDMRTLANNIKAAVKNEIYNQSRPGGLLYNPR